MRFSAVTAIFPVLLASCIALSACTSGGVIPEASVGDATPARKTTRLAAAPTVPSGPTQSGIQLADLPSGGPSPETDLVAIPPAGVSNEQTGSNAPALAWGGQVPQSHAFDELRPTTVGMPMPVQKPIASLKPAVLEEDDSDEDDTPIASPRPGSRDRMRVYGHRFRDAKPINFGSASPKKFAVHGVDVSRWQGDIDWMQLRMQGANFAYIKATDGGDHLDPMFRTNWRGAKDAGIKRGAYHFFYWCRTAGEQADWFIRNVPRDPEALPPVIDVEYNGESSCKMRLSRAKVLEKMQVFMDKLERYYGQRPIIYTAPDFYKDNLAGEFLDYPFWLRSVAAHPSKRYPGRRWMLWQYSGSGLSHGVSGRIDLNVFNGSEDQWHAWLGRAGGAMASR